MNYPKRAAPAPFVFQSGVHRAHRQAALHVERECRSLGLTGPEAHMLGFIQSNAPCPLGELVRVFGHKRSTLTSILDRFEERGLLRRRLSDDDRRSFVVVLTARGQRVASAARVVATSLEESIARRVSPGDLAAFQRVLLAFAEAAGVNVRPTRAPIVPASRQRSGRPRATDSRPKRRSAS